MDFPTRFESQLCLQFLGSRHGRALLRAPRTDPNRLDSRMRLLTRVLYNTGT